MYKVINHCVCSRYRCIQLNGRITFDCKTEFLEELALVDPIGVGCGK